MRKENAKDEACMRAGVERLEQMNSFCCRMHAGCSTQIATHFHSIIFVVVRRKRNALHPGWRNELETVFIGCSYAFRTLMK